MVTRVPRFSASLREPCTSVKRWKPAAATVVHGPALPSGLAGLRVQLIPGLSNSARRRETRHGARATAPRGRTARMHLRTGAVLGEFWESQGEQHTE